MKTVLTERKEIARALNFGKYPVLSINLDNQPYKEDLIAMEKKDVFIKGCECKVAWDQKDPRYEGMTSKCDLIYENGQYMLTSGGCMLKAEYTMNDFLDNIKNANLPTIHKGQIVAVAHYSLSSKIKFVHLMKVCNRIDTNCMVVTTLEDIKEE